jgi:hypothetical protein
VLRALTASVLFSCFEALNDNACAALPHLIHARKIVDHCKVKRDDQDSRKLSRAFPTNYETIEPLLVHFETQVESRGFEHQFGPETPCISGLDPSKQVVITRVSDAKVHLERAIAKLGGAVLTLLDSPTPEQRAKVSETKALMVIYIDRWDAAFTDFLARNNESLDAADHQACRLLMAHKIAAHTLAAVPHGSGEEVWSSFNEDFSTIVSLIEQMLAALPKRGPAASPPPQTPYLNPSMGMTEPLYVVCARCTDPTTVQKAKELWHRLPHNEGAWSSWRISFLEANLCAATGKKLQSRALYFGNLASRSF